ncbi:uncharacterized protein LOC119402618 [Rhipicephalus sanguineus]|uniref:uncharacterized protein LOC119402618 n=1 Tax=Rhipicephalus sanguineus TaxID=34632 RepID=UPI0018951290|nr:uncharacterized protein LOC119402618 [Rhipicephalus sanguineus]
MTSFMKQRFKWYGRFCMVSGLPFLQLHGIIKGKNNRLPWKQLYLIYSLICFAQFVVIQVLYFCQILEAVLDDVQLFTKSLYILLFAILTFKVVLNYCCAIVKSRSLLAFFKSSTKYEVTAGFVAPKCCGQATTCLVARLLLCLAFMANVAGSTYLSFEYLDYLGYTGMLDVILRAICVGGNFLFYVFEMVHFIVIRPCAEVIRLYIRHQHELLHTVLDARCNVPIAKRSKELEAIRINLCAIAALKQQLNATWRWSIMASGVIVLTASCICIYSAFTEEYSAVQHLLTILYSISSALDFVDIANVSQQLVNEMRKIRHTLQKAPTYFENEVYYNQLSHLRASIKPKEMALSGAGFFTFNLPLVVSLAGAVITYTVILVQTSESVKT